MRLTRGQIIDQALQRVGNTTQSLIAVARIRLNRIIQDLSMGWDWPFLWTTATITITPPLAVFSLPEDFLKPEDEQALVVFQTRDTLYNSPMQEVDHRTFQQLARPGVETTIPKIWTIDYQAVLGLVTARVWPTPTDSCECTLRYKMLPPDKPTATASDYDNDVPPFPYDSLLVDLLFEWAMSYEVDPRRAEQLQVNESTVQRVRGVAFPDRSFPGTIPLDPLYFTTPSWGRGNP